MILMGICCTSLLFICLFLADADVFTGLLALVNLLGNRPDSICEEIILFPRNVSRITRKRA